MPRLQVTNRISLAESEIEETFIRASGPGGQHVNRAATAVQLRFDVRASASLPGEVAHRLMKLAGRRLTREGVIVITADRYRSQQRNREDALERLFGLIRRAALRPTPRLSTQPTRASCRRRLETKKARGSVKRLRARPAPE